jgi:hypothetical protein
MEEIGTQQQTEEKVAYRMLVARIKLFFLTFAFPFLL